ncbi:MAG: sulfurtransferase-like selenium metabolism protein YedF, partial [Synergistaceae bacterium]|nr:sulfurtransferase-like selenium metabolism protein YedF [Synergistaceae bacterium]
TMGDGAEELGKILIKGFIYSLTELPAPPEYVIFLNSGAFLTSDGSNTIDDLKKLENKGAKILTCGTCVNFYGLQDKLAIGTITNMYGITEIMVSTGAVINI